VNRLCMPVVLWALSLACPTGTAIATVGGPAVVEVLGWDAKDHKVFFRVHWYDESDRAAIYYFALDGRSPERAVRVPTTSPEDTESRAARIRPRLKPLTWIPHAAMPRWFQIVSRDSVRDEHGCPDRYHVRAVFHWGELGIGPSFEVQTRCTPEVVLADAYRVPGRAEVIAVLAFIGDSFEGGYETQVPVLFRAGEERVVRHVRWERK
jgi:hypothetical protein